MLGGCYCGALRYEVPGARLMSAQCHCRACQYFSGGGPNYYMLLPADGLTYTRGTLKHFTRPNLEGAVTRGFCADCGTHIETRRPDMPYIILKAGTLDTPADFGQPSMAIYTCDTQPFHLIPEGLPTHQGLPPRR